MVIISRFRSLWGIAPGPNQSAWKQRFTEWKAQGYAGIEACVADMGPDDLKLLRSICDELDLDTSVTLFSSWPSYIGPRPRGITPDTAAEFFRGQLQLASILKPVVVNAQSGADYWTWDDSVRFYQKALEVEKQEGFQGRVCHETHRNRSLFHPYAADYILQRVPDLRITADISHWVVVSERLLDQGEEDQEILDRMIPHVGHIHARIGTIQSSQCPEPLNPVFEAERAFFEKLWSRIIVHRRKTDPNARITWVPEYGPFPYHPINTAQTFSYLADSEGKRLQTLFESVKA